ncbi:MAG: lipopolysaccharide biosynthesis protein [Luteibaculaceae bacterium]
MKAKIKNVFINTLASGIHFGSRWLINVFLARNLGFLNFGIYSYITAIAALATSFYTYGTNTYLLHAYSKETALGLLVRGIKITFFLFSTTFPLFFLVSYLNFAPPEYKNQLFWGAIIALGFSLTAVFYSYFKGQQQYSTDLKIQIFSLLGAIPIFLAIYFFGSNLNIHVLLATYAFYALMPIILFGRIIWLSVKTINFVSFKRVIHGLKSQWSYLIVDFQGILHINIAFFILGSDANAETLGVFRAIYILLMPFQMIIAVMNQVMLTELSKIYTQTPQIYWKKQLKLTFPSFALGIIFWVFYHFSYETLFKFINKSNQAILVNDVLFIFSIFILIFAIKSAFEITLTAIGKHYLRSRGQWIAIGSMVLMYYTLPFNPLKNMALAYLLSNSLLMLIFLLYTLNARVKHRIS